MNPHHLSVARRPAARHWYAMAAALAGILFFLALYGVQVLDPANPDWILNRGPDPSQHYLGWEFYRQSPLRLPFLGMSYSTVYPYRISVLYTDSIPLLALLLRPVAALLPAQFQYLGLWGIGCFALQGFLAQKIAWKLSDAQNRGPAVRIGTVAAAVLALLYPVLTVRMFGHTALAGNWLILLGLWLWLCCRGGTLRSCLWWGLAGILCAGIHQYYLPMLGICAVGYAIARLMRRDRPAPALLPVLSFCVCALAELLVLGAFSGNFADTDPSGWFTGADPLNLLLPGLYSGWEVDIFVGWGILLAALLALVAGIWQLVRRRTPLGTTLRRRLPWLVSALVMGLLSLFAASSNTFVVGGVTLGTLPLPAPVYDLWRTFACCGRLAWLAGYLLLVLGSGMLLRFGRTAGLAALVVCVAVQAGWRADALLDRYRIFHDDALYHYETPLQDSGWQTIAGSGQFSHLMFASHDIDDPDYWPLVVYAQQNGWTVNSFYLAHLQSDLLQRTIQGELSTPQPDALYVFPDGNQLQQKRLETAGLHFYRLDGILVGSVNPLPLPEADAPGPVAVDLSRCDANAGASATQVSADGITIAPGEMISTNEWTLQPGSYTVTVRGSGLDHSYIHSGYRGEETLWTEQDIVFLTGEPDRMVFQFTVQQPVIGWCVQIHTLDDTPVQISGITVEAN